MPRVAILTDSYWPARGGMEESIRSLTAELKAWYRIEVVTHAAKPIEGSLVHRTALLPACRPYYDPSGVPVRCLTPGVGGRLGLLATVCWDFPLLRRVAAAGLYDLLYHSYRLAFRRALSARLNTVDLVHTFSTGYLSRLAIELCHAAHKPVIAAPPLHFGEWGDSPGQLSAFSHADVFICPTRSFAQTIRGYWLNGKADIVINPPLQAAPPARLVPPPGMPTNKPYALFLGRRDEYKGADLLISAFSGLVHSGWRLILAGPGPKTLCPPGGDILDFGEVSDAQKAWLLKNCSIFSLPSSSESFGMVFTEAMSYAKPVVALDISPVNEIVQHERTGVLVSPGDRDGLRLALLRLVNSKSLCRTLGAAGRRRYEKAFSRTKILESLQTIYYRLTEGRSGGFHQL